VNHIAAVVQPGTFAEGGVVQAAGPAGVHVERTDSVEVRPAGAAPAPVAPPERTEAVTVRPSGPPTSAPAAPERAEPVTPRPSPSPVR
jgi:hypothetical protein